MILTYTVPPEKAGRLLRSLLTQELKLSNTMLKRLKAGQLVGLNGRPAYLTARAGAGDTLTVTLPENGEGGYPAEKGPLAVLYEDALFLAADKPAGMLVHPSRSRFYGTLANYVAGYLGCGAHAVTRLDRDTRGVVLFAKNAYARALIEAADLEKTYEGVVFGVPERLSGRIDLPIARFCPESMIRVVRTDGQRAATAYEVVKTVDFLGEKLSVLRFHLETGRTHQIRVHCLAMGFPLLGDPLYCSPESQALSLDLGLAGQELTAVRLAFVHPLTGEMTEIRSKYPQCLDKERDIM